MPITLTDLYKRYKIKYAQSLNQDSSYVLTVQSMQIVGKRKETCSGVFIMLL